MHIATLALQNFRLYDELHIALSPGLTVIVGPNASGKTTILEALHVLATTKSPRSHQDRRLVRNGAAYSRIEGNFISQHGEATTVATLLPGYSRSPEDDAPVAKQVKLNGRPIQSLSEIMGRVPLVMFSADDLIVVKGPPAARRRFLNMALAQLRPRYLDDLHRYRRALSQRNEVLKMIRSRRARHDDLHPWDQQLADFGAALALDRRELVETLGRAAADVHGTLTAHAERLQLRYQADLSSADDANAGRSCLAELLNGNREADVERGFTAVGPHRDDFDILADGKSLRLYGSQGQQRTAALSLKLAEAQVAMAWRHEPPLLLLDDCLSELDDARAGRVLQLADQLQGLIVTSPTLDGVLADCNDARFVHLRAGTIEQITCGPG